LIEVELTMQPPVFMRWGTDSRPITIGHVKSIALASAFGRLGLANMVDSTAVDRERIVGGDA